MNRRLLAIVLPVLVALAGCDRQPRVAAAPAAEPPDARAVQLMRHYGCGTCHTIPGVPSANGLVGPPLAGLKGRAYIGGVVTNTRDNLTRWIQSPRGMAPKTAMPDVGVSEADAKIIATYLYSK